MRIRKPDWNYWKHIPAERLMTVVYLSLDIDPEQQQEIEHYDIGHEWRKSYKSSKMGRMVNEIKYRLGIASANLKITNMGDVDIADFGKFARLKEWDIPAEYPVERHESKSQDLAVGEFGDDEKIYPKNLHIAFIAWRAVAVNGEGEGTTVAGRLSDWLTRKYPDLWIGEHNAIVKVCNWNPKVGRPKGS